MAYSKTLLFLGVLFAVVLVISSEVSARELAETAQTQSVQMDNVEDSKFGYGHGHGKGYGHGHGHGHGHGKPGHGGHPGHGDSETDANQN